VDCCGGAVVSVRECLTDKVVLWGSDRATE
jgi:hypothetical protein